MTTWEQQIEEYTNRVIVHTEAHDKAGLTKFMGGLNVNELQAVTVALAMALLRQEAANQTLATTVASTAAKNRTLESGNIALFRERKRLETSIAELRQIQKDQAKRIETLRTAAA